MIGISASVVGAHPREVHPQMPPGKVLQRPGLCSDCLLGARHTLSSTFAVSYNGIAAYAVATIVRSGRLGAQWLCRLACRYGSQLQPRRLGRAARADPRDRQPLAGLGAGADATAEPERDVIALDLPGFGASVDAAAWHAAGPSFADRLVVEFLDSSGSSARTSPATRSAAGSRSSWPSAAACAPSRRSRPRVSTTGARVVYERASLWSAVRAARMLLPVADRIAGSPTGRKLAFSLFVAHPELVPADDAVASSPRSRTPRGSTRRSRRCSPSTSAAASRSPRRSRSPGASATGCCFRQASRAGARFPAHGW